MKQLPKFVVGILYIWQNPWYTLFCLLALTYLLVEAIHKNASTLAIAIYGVYVGIVFTVLLGQLVDTIKERKSQGRERGGVS